MWLLVQMTLIFTSGRILEKIGKVRIILFVTLRIKKTKDMSISFNSMNRLSKPKYDFRAVSLFSSLGFSLT